MMRHPRLAFFLAFGSASAGAFACSSTGISPPTDASFPIDAGTTDDASGDDAMTDDVVADAGTSDDATEDSTIDDGALGVDVASDAVDAPALPLFSFFYTSVEAMKRLSGSPNGFGGDLRFGMPTGLEGADKICQTIATDVGFGAKTWKAFLSATKGLDGQPVNAIDRIGQGPWYDRKGRLIAQDRAGLLMERPAGDMEAVNDLPDETGEGTALLGSTDAITGTNAAGKVYFPEAKNTCMDWTNKTLEGVFVMGGHAWRVSAAAHWMQAHPTRSCVPGIVLNSDGTNNGSSIGAGGGWGGFYCFALTP